MKIVVMAMGKPRESFILQGWQHYELRLKPLLPLEWLFLAEPGKGKNLTEDQRRELEGAEFLSRLTPSDRLFLLDERGQQWTSVELSRKLYDQLSRGGNGRLVFLIGGPYGTSQALQSRADGLISLSKLTFTHEMALLLLSEQLYRAAMIQNGSKYHH